jgi:hypothetical protein
MSIEEKNNILDQHKSLYDGYVTKYNQESNQYPLYVQDLANDKNGVTLNNKGTVKSYTNIGINESPLDRIADGPTDLKNGTVDIDSVGDTIMDNTEFMHDVIPSPNEEESDYQSFGTFADEMLDNKDQYEYDIDELEDYSVDDMNEELNIDLDKFDSDTEESDEIDFEEVDEEDLPDVLMNIKESIDMFNRFKKYN